jgi:hypothetical protein
VTFSSAAKPGADTTNVPIQNRTKKNPIQQNLFIDCPLIKYICVSYSNSNATL